VEKPFHPSGDWAFSGLMIGTPEMLEIIPPDTPADIGFHVLPRLTGRMIAFPIRDYLIDIGTMENYRRRKPPGPDFLRLDLTMLRGVVFDMDGVIIDSHPAHRLAWKAFLESVVEKPATKNLILSSMATSARRSWSTSWGTGSGADCRIWKPKGRVAAKA